MKNYFQWLKNLATDHQNRTRRRHEEYSQNIRAIDTHYEHSTLAVSRNHDMALAYHAASDEVTDIIFMVKAMRSAVQQRASRDQISETYREIDKEYDERLTAICNTLDSSDGILFPSSSKPARFIGAIKRLASGYDTRFDKIFTPEPTAKLNGHLVSFHVQYREFIDCANNLASAAIAMPTACTAHERAQAVLNHMKNVPFRPEPIQFSVVPAAHI